MYRTVIASTALAVCFVPAAFGQTYWYWSPDGLGGGGSWNTSSSFWAPNADGSGVKQAWPNSPNYPVAVFRGAGGTVTVGDNGVTADWIRLETSGYEIGGGTLALAGGISSVSVLLAAGEATISASIAGGDGLTKLAGGVLRLGGDNVYSGTTTVSAGVLALDSAGVAVPDDLVLSGGHVTFHRDEQIGSTANVIITSGHLNSTSGSVDGRKEGHVETIGSLTATGGSFQTGSAAKWTIGGQGVFAGGDGNTKVVVGSATELILAGLSLTDFTSSSVASNNSFAIYGASNALTTVLVGSGGLTLDNSRLLMRRGNTSGQVGNALILDGDLTASGASTIEIVAGYTVGTSTLRLSSGADAVTRTFDVVGDQSTLRIDSVVANGQSVAAGILKTGLGSLTFTGVNTYSGGTQIHEGRLALSGGGTLPNSAVVLTQAAAILDVSAVSSASAVGSLAGVAGTSVLLGAKLLNAGGDNTSTAFAGSISGDGGRLTKLGAGTLTLSGANTYSGPTTVSEGVLLLDSSGIAVPGDLGISGGSVMFSGKSYQIGSNANVTIAVGSHLNSASGATNQRTDGLTEAFASLTAAGGSFMAGNNSSWTISGDGSFTGGSGRNTKVLIHSGAQLSFGGLTLESMTSTSVDSGNSFALYGAGSRVTEVAVGSGGLTLNSARILMRKGNVANHQGLALILGGDLTARGASTIQLVSTASYTFGPAQLRLASTADSVDRIFDIDGATSRLRVEVDVVNGAAATAGLRKTGLGTLTLAGTGAYTGDTVIEQGSLLVHGSLEATSRVVLHSGAKLGGSGVIATVVAGDGAAAGLISPGESAGILTVESIDPSGGMSFEFEFGQIGGPNYANAGDSLNDVLRLTGGLPAVGLAPDNVVNVYFNVDQLSADDVFLGGIYVDLAVDPADRDQFFDMVKDAAYNYTLPG